jgi:hypothetical protein
MCYNSPLESARLSRARPNMLARQAVLLTPSRCSGPTQLLSCKQNASVSPLFATLTSHPQVAENTATLSPFFATLTASAPVTPVFATLTKNAGCHFISSHSGTRHSPLVTRHYSPSETRQSARFLAFIPTKTQNPLLCFQRVAHSSAIRGEGGVAPFHPTEPPPEFRISQISLPDISSVLCSGETDA